MENDILRPVASTVPATASFRIEWRAKKARKRRGLGLKVRPECSYAVIQFKRHPEWSDLLAQ